jgi:hypothetical protein
MRGQTGPDNLKVKKGDGSAMTNTEEHISSDEERTDQIKTTLPVEFPAEPSSPDDTGLSRSLLNQLLTKALYVSSELTELSVGRLLKLPYSIVKELLTALVKEKLCEVKGPSDSSGILFRYTLTGFGMTRAQEYMEVSTYVGPAPVPLYTWRSVRTLGRPRFLSRSSKPWSTASRCRTSPSRVRCSRKR